jgi:hypothetical protein
MAFQPLGLVVIVVSEENKAFSVYCSELPFIL